MNKHLLYRLLLGLGLCVVAAAFIKLYDEYLWYKGLSKEMSKNLKYYLDRERQELGD